jgi:hypothetical protein
MPADRSAQRVKAAVERRPPAAVQRSAAPAPAPARSLQERYGNSATQALIARAVAAGAVQLAAATVQRAEAPSAPPEHVPAAAAATAALAGAAEDAGAASAARSAPTAKSEPAKEAARPVAPARVAPMEAATPGRQEAPPAVAMSPREAIAPTVAMVHRRAARARAHRPAGVPVASAQAAAIRPRIEQMRAAAEETVTNLDVAKDQAKPVKRDDFRSKLREAIRKATQEPKTESQAENVMRTGAKQANETLRGHLASERDAATGPLRSQSAPGADVPASSQELRPQTPLEPEQVGAPPAPVSAASVVPAPLPAERLDYSSDREPTDRVMSENNVSKEQLEKGNEPAFGQTLEARATAEEHETRVVARYRQSEAKGRDQARQAAQAELAKGLGAMHGSRLLHVEQVVGTQVDTRAKNALERQRVTDRIIGIKDRTRSDVADILASMETEAANIFEAGLKRAEKAYEDTFKEEKGGAWTWITTWGSDWEKLIESSLAKAREKYLQEVDIAIDRVADLIDGKLTAAKRRVAEGWEQVETFVSGLDQSVQHFADDALKAVRADFDAMSAEIDQRGGALVDKLAQQYKASYERMSAMEEKLREENKSLWQRVYDATIGVIKKILAFKDMLLSILAKAASVIVDIISDPIGFLGNLISGVMRGLKNFISNIDAHLKKGLMEWLFGALGGAGLQLPDSFDLKGIVSIVLQVLKLTYASFRARAVALVGEPLVAALERTAEVFKIIATEGIAGLWRFIKEKVDDLKSMVLDAIFDFIKERVIIAGVEWIIGLLNPVSAFFKACKAIYDIVVFFINRGSQIIDLVNAIIDSIAAIAKGSIGTAVTMVENALAKAIPVAIGFLASLLKLGDISATIRKTIEKAQAPVNKAIDWVLAQAVGAVKKLIGKVGGKEEAKDVRQLVKTALAKNLKEGRALKEATATIAKVESEYKPLGLTKLEVGPPDKEGAHVIFAEASEKRPIGRLMPHVPVPAGRSVISRVEYTLSVPVKIALTKLEAPRESVPSIREKGAGFVESVGGGKSVVMKTWNTSPDSLNVVSSHAEHFIVNYMEMRESDWPNIEKFTLDNSTFSPCSACCDELVGLFKKINKKRKDAHRPDVELHLSWTKLYTGRSPTNKDNISELRGLKCQFHVDPSEFPVGATPLADDKKEFKE